MSDTTRSALVLLVLAACSLAPDGPDGLSGGGPASTSAGSSSGPGTTDGGDDSSGGSTSTSIGEAATTSTGGPADDSAGSTSGEPTACGTPAIYEACEPTCPGSCAAPGVCLEPDGPGSAFCSSYCNADPECPASTHGDYPTACALSLCWIACNDQIPDKPCPFGYWCWDPGADVQRPVCLPEGA